jgi:transcriptional regulator with GAF, ATPase, and Fis domain
MENISFKIVKNLPIPSRRPGSYLGRSSVYPFAEMEIGDCLKFEARSTRDSSYRRIYNSARSHARRRDCQYEFKFAQLDDENFGCWKVKKGSVPSEAKERRRRRTWAEINSIPAESIMEALQTEGTVAGAARRVGLSPRTFTRLLEKIK